MDRMGVILVVAAVTYATRLAGFALGRRAVPPAVERFLAFVPVAAFAALVAPGLTVGGGELAPRLLAATAAAIAVLRSRKLWLGLATGMAAYWAARALLG